jgi:hypothetical protein
MKKISVVLVMAFGVLLYACKHEIVNPIVTLPGGGVPVLPAPGEVCFDADVLPIFQSSCAKAGCHDAASKQDGYILDSYANILKKGIKPGNANDSKMYKVLIDTDPGDRMPQAPYAPLLQSQIDVIRKWINEGAKNTAGCNTCDTTKFTYAAAIKPIIDANCINCHSASYAGGNWNFADFNLLRAAALSGRLVGSISHNAGFRQMPQGSAKLSDCKITQIRKWVQAGAQNN